MAKKKSDPTENESVTQPSDKEDRGPRFVVVREGHRVSPNEYSNPHDPMAHEELEFWKHIATQYSWGEPVNIVPYDNKLHRIYTEHTAKNPIN